MIDQKNINLNLALEYKDDSTPFLIEVYYSPPSTTRVLFTHQCDAGIHEVLTTRMLKMTTSYLTKMTKSKGVK